jgi:hypothetical protein
MTYSCPHNPTIRLIEKIDSKYTFDICNDCKTDPDFSQGFTEEKI